MKKAMKFVPLILILAMVVVGCANFLSRSHTTLEFSADLYLLARQVAIDLYKDGIIDENQREQINASAKIFRNAYYVACDALAAYYETKSVSDKEKAKAALKAASDSWADIANLINAIKPGAIPDKLAEVEI